MSKEVATYKKALQSISKNSCCETCQEAAKVAKKALNRYSAPGRALCGLPSKEMEEHIEKYHSEEMEFFECGLCEEKFPINAFSGIWTVYRGKICKLCAIHELGIKKKPHHYSNCGHIFAKKD